MSHSPNLQHDKSPSREWIEPHLNDKITTFNRNCEVCFQPVSNSCEVLRCIYCNVVGHLSCLQNYKLNKTCEKPWTCFCCIDELEHDRKVYEQEKSKGRVEDVRKNSQIIIARNWRRYMARKGYLRIYSVIVKMQILFQIRQRKKAFLQSIQSKIRPIKIKLIRCSGIFITDREYHQTNIHNGNQKHKKKDHLFYVLVTVLDHTKGNNPQTWRIPSDIIKTQVNSNCHVDLEIDQKLMIGGVSGFHQIVLTLFLKGHSGRDIFFGQILIDLSYNYIWKRGGIFSLPLGRAEYNVKDSIGVEMKIDYRNEPQGNIEFELLTHQGMSSECCIGYGTSVDEFIRSLLKLPEYTGYSYTNYSPMMMKNNNNHTVTATNTTDTTATTATTTSGGKKKSSTSSTSASSSLSYSLPMKKLWIVIADGKLYIYNHFADQLKLSLELSYFQIQYESIGYRDMNVLYHITRTGYPEFQFLVVNDADIFRFKCAFLTSLRYGMNTANSTSASSRNGLPSARSTNGTNGTNGNGNEDKFDMNLLVADILSIEVTKLRKTNSAGNSNNNTNSNSSVNSHTNSVHLNSSISKSVVNNTNNNNNKKQMSMNLINMRASYAPKHHSISSNHSTHSTHSANNHTHTITTTISNISTTNTTTKTYGGWSSAYTNHLPDCHSLVQALFDEVEEELSCNYTSLIGGKGEDDNQSVSSIDTIHTTQSMQKEWFGNNKPSHNKHHNLTNNTNTTTISISSNTSITSKDSHSHSHSHSHHNHSNNKKKNPKKLTPTTPSQLQRSSSSSSKPAPLIKRASTLRFQHERNERNNELKNQLYEEFLKEEMVTNEKYQVMGQLFVQNVLTSVMETKLITTHHNKSSKSKKASIAAEIESKRPFASPHSPISGGGGGGGSSVSIKNRNNYRTIPSLPLTARTTSPNSPNSSKKSRSKSNKFSFPSLATVPSPFSS